MDRKDHFNIVVLGNVNSGKSTTVGHLVYKSGGLSNYQIKKRQEEAALIEEQSPSFAFILDLQKADRERYSTSLSNFESTKYRFTIIDIPGHKDFMKNMITGTSKADIGILVVSVTLGEFEEEISSERQTREHIFLAKTFGVKHMIVCINKMDADTVNWSEHRFNEIQKFICDCLEKAGFNPEKTPIIPTSGWTGDNVVDQCASENGTWYKGPTLIEALDNLPRLEFPKDKPLRIPIHDVFKLIHIGVLPCGRVETGCFKPPVSITFAVSGIVTDAIEIQAHHPEFNEAIPGDQVGFSLKRGPNYSKIKKGDVCGETERDPPKICEEFTAQIFLLHKEKIQNGYSPKIWIHNVCVPCKFEEILLKNERRTGIVQETNPESLHKGDCGEVRIIPMEKLCVESFSEYPRLGRFIVKEMGRIMIVGVIKTVKKSK